MQEKLLTIIGPTAVGKTKLSIHLAQRFDGEVISGDSMQVYRGMNIGTAKIKSEEMKDISHHLINILRPDQDYSVTQFQEEAVRIISQLNGQGKLPILVGGTGLYVQSVTHHFQFAEANENEVIRARWQAYVESNGVDALYEELKQRDPDYAQQLHPNNYRRVIRALEILELTGKSMSHYQQEWNKSSPYRIVMIGLTMEREKLYQRINQRVDQMMDEGLIEEVQTLLATGIPAQSTSLQAIGYKEIVLYLKGETSKVEAIELLKRNTRRFAKRQLTWFKRLKEITWFDVTNLEQWPQIEEIITKHVKESLNK